MKSIFVSSTFRDMQAERDMLAMKVIPELNVYAQNFGESIRFVDLRWGVNTTDLDSDEGSKKVLSVCFDEIDNTRPYMIILVGERYGWIPTKELIKNAAEKKKHELYDYEKSVTELEIEYGALADKGQLDQCLFYFREELKKEVLPNDIRGTYIEQDLAVEKKLKVLKERIKASGAVVKHYACEWDDQKNELFVPESFAKTVMQDVARLFERDFEKLINLTWQQREELSANLLAEQKAVQFSARYDILDEYIKKIKDQNTKIFLLRGESGSGKSTIMAKLSKEVSKNDSTFFFASGNSAYSQNAFDMLKQIVFKLETLLGATEHFGTIESIVGANANLNVENNIDKWVEKFEELAYLYENSNSKHLYIFCDAIDQLSDDDTVRNFSWLPATVFSKITVVISMLDNFELPMFMPMQKQIHTQVLSSLKRNEIPKVIDSIVSANGKELPDMITKKLSDVKNAKNPLYISMALQRLMMLDSSDFSQIAAGGNDMTAINAYMLKLIDDFPVNTEEMSAFVLKEAAERIDETFCNHVSSLLSVSRRGLRDTDLQVLFSQDDSRFSAVDLSLFTKYMQNFFMRRDDGRLDFTHRVIRLGLLNNVDFKRYNAKILEHLKMLPDNDAVKSTEIVWHAYKDDDKVYLIKYIDAIQAKNDEIYLKKAASELREIAIKDVAWMSDLIKFGVNKTINRQFVYFLNYSFFENFSASVVEYEILSSLYQILIDILSSEFGEYSSCKDKKIMSMTLERIGDIYKILGKYKEALEISEKSLRIRKSLADEENNDETKLDLAKINDKIGDIYQNFVTGNFELIHNSSSLASYATSLKIREAMQDRLKTVEFMHNLAINHMKIGDVDNNMMGQDDALESYDKALHILNSLKDEHKPTKIDNDIALCYDKIGNAYKYLGENSKALEFFRKGNVIFVDLANRQKTLLAYRNLAKSHEQMSFAYRNLGDADKAKEYYQNSLDILIRLKNELNTPEAYRDLSDCYITAGDVHKNFNDIEEAMRHFREGIKIREELAENLETGESHKDLDTNYFSIANTYEFLKKYDDALKLYEKCIILRERISKENIDYDQQGLALRYRKSGDMHKKLKNYDEMILSLDKSLEIHEKYTSKRNNYIAFSGLVTAYNLVGGIYKDLEYHDKSLKVYLKSLDLQKRILENPKNAKNSEHDKLASLYKELADIYEKLNDYKEAKNYYLESITVRELLANSENSYDADMDLLLVYDDLVEICDELDDHEDKLKYCLKGVEICEKHIEKNSSQSLDVELTSILASAYETLGDFYKSAGDLRSTNDTMLKESEQRTKLDDMDDTLDYDEEYEELADRYEEISDVYIELNNYEEALIYYKKYMNILKSLHHDEDDIDTKKELSDGYVGLSKLHLAVGDSVNSAKVYELHTETLKEIVTLNSVVSTYDEYITALDELSDMHMRNGDDDKSFSAKLKAADSSYNVAMAVKEKDRYINTAQRYRKLGKTFFKNKSNEKAVSYLQRSLKTYELAYGLDRSVTLYEQLGICYRLLVSPCIEYGNDEWALLYAKKQFEIYEFLYDNLKTHEYHKDLISGLESCIKLSEKLNSDEKEFFKEKLAKIKGK